MLALKQDGSEEDEGSQDAVVMTSLLPQAGEIRVVLLGEVGVDSGQLMITDPCCIDQEWKGWNGDGARHHSYFDQAVGEEVSDREETDEANDIDRALAPFSYQGAMKTTLSASYGELAFKRGHAGAGAVFQTAWGDGNYPVYGELHDGRIVRAYINAG